MVVFLLARGGPRALDGITYENAEAPIVLLKVPSGGPAGERLQEGYAASSVLRRGVPGV